LTELFLADNIFPSGLPRIIISKEKNEKKKVIPEAEISNKGGF